MNSEAPKKSRLPRYIFRLLISVALVYVLIRFVGDEKVLSHAKKLPVLDFALAFGLFLLAHVASAAKWLGYLKAAGTNLAFKRALFCHYSGLSANLFLPSMVGGDVVRAGLAFGDASGRASVVLGSVADRLSDTLALALLSLAGLALASSAVADMPESSIHPGVLIGLAMASVIVGALLVLFFIRALRSRKLPRKWRRRAIAATRSLRVISQRKMRMALLVLVSVLIQAFLIVLNARLGESMGLPMDLRIWFLIWPLAKIAAMLPVSLGGIGFRDAVFAGLLAPLGIPLDAALAVSLVWQAIIVLAGGVGGLLWLGRSLRGTNLKEKAH